MYVIHPSIFISDFFLHNSLPTASLVSFFLWRTHFSSQDVNNDNIDTGDRTLMVLLIVT